MGVSGNLERQVRRDAGRIGPRRSGHTTIPARPLGFNAGELRFANGGFPDQTVLNSQPRVRTAIRGVQFRDSNAPRGEPDADGADLELSLRVASSCPWASQRSRSADPIPHRGRGTTVALKGEGGGAREPCRSARPAEWSRCCQGRSGSNQNLFHHAGGELVGQPFVASVVREDQVSMVQAKLV